MSHGEGLKEGRKALTVRVSEDRIRLIPISRNHVCTTRDV